MNRMNIYDNYYYYKFSMKYILVNKWNIINLIFFVTVQSQEEGKQTPFQSALPTNDVTYSLRHVEESWIHLLKAGGKLQYFNVSLIDILQ